MVTISLLLAQSSDELVIAIQLMKAKNADR